MNEYSWEPNTYESRLVTVTLLGVKLNNILNYVIISLQIFLEKLYGKNDDSFKFKYFLVCKLFCVRKLTV